MSMSAVAVVMASLLGTAGDAPDKLTGDSKLVQGSWDWDQNEKQSDARPVVLVEKVVIKGDTLTIHYSLDGKKFTTPTTFKLDSDGTPKHITFTPTDAGNANKGKEYLGLYEVTAGQLKICYRGPGSSRPKGFKDISDGNNATTFLHLKPTPKPGK